MKICEYCKKEYDGLGKRFCSPYCWYKTGLSKESIEKGRLKNLGRIPKIKGKTFEEFFGKKKAEEIKRKQSIGSSRANKITWKNKETRRKRSLGISLAMKNKKLPAETRHKMSLARKGKTKNKEWRKKISLSNIKTKNSKQWKETIGKKVIEKVKKARAKQIFPKKDSSKELKVQQFLMDLGIPVLTHKNINQIQHRYQ